MVRTI